MVGEDNREPEFSRGVFEVFCNSLGLSTAADFTEGERNCADFNESSREARRAAAESNFACVCCTYCDSLSACRWARASASVNSPSFFVFPSDFGVVARAVPLCIPSGVARAVARCILSGDLWLSGECMAGGIGSRVASVGTIIGDTKGSCAF